MPGSSVRGAQILVLGAAYKPDVGDVRESPAVKIMQHLCKRGARVDFHDPYVAEVAVNGTTLMRKELTNHSVARADTGGGPHPAQRLRPGLGVEHAGLVFDARNAYGSRRPANVVRL